jgi:hypothetical protein
MKLYNRMKGRWPELQEFLFTLKIDFVNLGVKNEIEDLKKVVIQDQIAKI